MLKASKGKLDKNCIEGMACEGGCVGGPACFSHGLKARTEVDKFAQQALKKTEKKSNPLMVSAK